MRILVALGGNALLQRDQPADAQIQQKNVEVAAKGLAAIAAEHELVVTHGNGPQVGLLALQNDAYKDVEPYPLDVLGAESEGMVGYMLGVALRNELPEREIVTVLTEVVVDPDDPAFDNPTKPIGPVYSPGHAEVLAWERGWSIAKDGSGCRRVVASPEPSAIAELPTLRLLVDSGTVVVCAGGGGIPVALSPAGTMQGVEAVIDKDLTSSLLARRLNVDLLLMLTDVDAVQLDWGTEKARPLAGASAAELRQHDFPAGSMGPKVEAACRFVEATDRRAAIGQLKDAVAIVRGEAGTQVGSLPA